MQIKLNRSGKFELRWTERREGRSVTKTQSCGTSIKAEAEQYLKDFLTGKKAADVAIEASPLITDLLDSYERAMTAKGAGATQGYCIKHLRDNFQGERVSGIDHDRVLQYVEDRDVADPTARRELATLRAALKLGYKNRKLTLADIPHIELPPEGAPRTAFLTETEEAEFRSLALAYVPTNDPTGHTANGRLSRLARFVCLVLDTGVRKDAAQELTWDRIDLEEGVIDFRVPGVVYKNKKRGIIPINSRLLPLLQRAKEEATTEWFLDHPGEIKKQFMTFVKGTPYAHIGPHSLRRTFATLLLRNGVDLDTVAELLHDSPEITKRHYASFDMRGKQAAMARRFG